MILLTISARPVSGASRKGRAALTLLSATAATAKRLETMLIERYESDWTIFLFFSFFKKIDKGEEIGKRLYCIVEGRVSAQDLRSAHTKGEAFLYLISSAALQRPTQS